MRLSTRLFTRAGLPVVGAVLAGALVAGVGHTSQVHFQPLEEVVAKSPLVFDAEVVKATRSNTKQDMTMEWELKDPHAIRGALPAALTRATYREIIPVMYDDKGNVVGSFSPILAASGEEWNAKSGRWIFLASSVSSAAGPLVMRVEPMSQLATIQALITKTPDAGAVAVLSSPKPSAAPSAVASSTSEPAPPPTVKSSRGCGCDVPGARSGRGAVALTAASAAVALLRRRRRRSYSRRDDDLDLRRKRRCADADDGRSDERRSGAEVGTADRALGRAVHGDAHHRGVPLAPPLRRDAALGDRRPLS